MAAEAAIEPPATVAAEPPASILATAPLSALPEATKTAGILADLAIVCETPRGTDEPRSPLYSTDDDFGTTAIAKLRRSAEAVSEAAMAGSSRMDQDAMSDLSSVPPSENEEEDDTGRRSEANEEDDSELSSEDGNDPSSDEGEEDDSDLSELSSSDGEEQDANEAASEEGRGSKRHSARSARAKIGADAARPFVSKASTTVPAPSEKRSHKAKHSGNSKGRSHKKKVVDPNDSKKYGDGATSSSAHADLAQSLFDGAPRRATRNAVAVVEAAEAAAKADSAAVAAKAAKRSHKKKITPPASAAQQQPAAAAEEVPAVPLTERQKAKIEADKIAAAAEAQKKRETKKLEAEKKKEQKRKERLAWQEYRRQQIEEEQALLAQQQDEEVVEEPEQEVSPAKPRSHKKAKLNKGVAAATSGTAADEEGDEMDVSTASIRATGRRGKKAKYIVHKKAPVEPLHIPDYLALSPELRNKPSLQDVRPAYFYPDLPSCSLEDWDEDGVPVFQPTMDQFEDFYAFMSAVDAWGMRSGIVKIIPPKEWLDALPSIRKADVEAAGFDPRAALESVRIKSAIEQNFTLAGSGVWRQANVVRPNKVWNVKTWADESAAPRRKGPELKRMQRKCVLDDEAKEAARKGVEVVGSKTRSGRLVDSHSAAHDKQQKKRKRESNAAPSANEAPRETVS